MRTILWNNKPVAKRSSVGKLHINMKRILKLYMEYAFFIGTTSLRLGSSNTYKITRFTRFYSKIINAIMLIVIPVIFWSANEKMHDIDLVVPWLVWYTRHVFYIVYYTALIYTVLSRSSRDRVLLELQDVFVLLTRLMDRPLSVRWHQIERTYSVKFYMKIAAVVYMLLANMMQVFAYPIAYTWLMLPAILFYVNAMNILNVTTQSYYLCLWQLARGFHFINQELTELTQRIGCTMTPGCQDITDLRQLWSAHSSLSCILVRINKSFSAQMTAARFDYITYSVFNAYWGILFSFDVGTPWILIIFGGLTYVVRLFDIFLVDLMCDLLAESQHCTHNKVSEIPWFKELNAFVIYTKSCRLNLWECGLYTANRRRWFKMSEMVLISSITLLQFHLLLRNVHKDI